MNSFRSSYLGMATLLFFTACSGGGGQSVLPATPSQTQDAGTNLSAESVAQSSALSPVPATYAYSTSSNTGIWTITNTSGASLNIAQMEFTMAYPGSVSSFWGSPYMNWSFTQSSGVYTLTGGSTKGLAAGATMTIEFTYDHSVGAPTNPHLYLGSGTPPSTSPSASPTAKPTATPTARPTVTPTAKPTATPTARPTATPTAKPSATPTARPSATPTARPSATPTAKPSATPTAKPSATPTARPTATPTARPTATPAPTSNPNGTFPGSQLPPGTLSNSVPPSTNFALSNWELQLPIGSTGSPTTISGSQLAAGYTSTYFHTDSSTGALDFYSPEPPPNCVTTANSLHCRSELEELTTWAASGTNVLTATVAVTQVAGTTVVGQIHPIESDTNKPLCELFYSSSGVLQMGVEQTTAGGNEVNTTIGQVPVGQKFTYMISFSKGVLSASINGATPTTFPVGSTFASNFLYYFKAGDYGQGTSADSDSFYGIHTVHS
jgi:hypothetical protein